MTLRQQWNDRASRAMAGCEETGNTGGLDAFVMVVVWMGAWLIERITR